MRTWRRRLRGLVQKGEESNKLALGKKNVRGLAGNGYLPLLWVSRVMGERKAKGHRISQKGVIYTTTDRHCYAILIIDEGPWLLH